MADFPELRISWAGESYSCTLPFSVIREIEQEGDIFTIVSDLLRDTPKLSLVAWVIYCLLKGAGAKVTPEEIWEALRLQEFTRDQIDAVRQYLLVETFGTGPEKPGKKHEAGSPGDAAE